MGVTEGGLAHILSASSELKKDYQIEVICPNLPENRRQMTATYKGVKIVCLGSSNWIKGYSRMPSLSFYRRAFSYVRRENPDILVGNNLLASALLRLLPKRIVKVGVLHHLYHTHTSTRGSDGLARMVRRIAQFERLSMRFLSLNGIGAVSPQVRNALVREGYPADRIVVVGNGVDLGEYTFSQAKVPGTLIYIGRLAELKGVESLIDVVGSLKEEFPYISLNIVGGGPKEDELRQKSRYLGVSDKVVLHGYLTERQKIDLLRRSGIYVSNSQFEGFGIPLVEAMATGTVPVVSDIDSHRWVFQGKRVGYLVKDKEEMAERVASLLKDEHHRQSLARNARTLVERQWNWMRVGRRYGSLLAKSLTSPQTGLSSGTVRALS